MTSFLRSVLALAFFLASYGEAPAQSFRISPVTASYEGMVAWSSQTGGPGDVLSWAKERLSGKISQNELETLKMIDIEWEGSPTVRECSDVRQLAYTARSSSDRIAIRLCLRTLMYMTDMSRGLLYTASLPKIVDEPFNVRLAAGYLEYLHSVAQDDNNRGLPYNPFCTAEFVIYGLSTNRFPPSECLRKDVLAANTQDFQTWYAKGEIAPSGSLAIFLKNDHRPTEVAMKDTYFELLSYAYRPILYSVIAHEVGHVMSCHFGSVGSLNCSEPALIRPKMANFDQAEFQADAWAMKQLARELSETPRGFFFSSQSPELRQTVGSLNGLLLNRVFASITFIDLTTMKGGEEIQARIYAQSKNYEQLCNDIANEVQKNDPELGKYLFDMSRALWPVANPKQ